MTPKKKEEASSDKDKTTSERSNGDKENLGFETLVNNSIKFQQLRGESTVAVKLSLTGITNLVVNYEDPCLVDCFLKSCFKTKELYNETYEIDAVELQKGRPGQGFACSYLDNLIFGTCETESSQDGLA